MAQHPLTAAEYASTADKAWRKKWGDNTRHAPYLGCMLGIMYENYFKYINRVGIYRQETQEQSQQALRGKMQFALGLYLATLFAMVERFDSYVSFDKAENIIIKEADEWTIKFCMAELSHNTAILNMTADDDEGYANQSELQAALNACYGLCHMLALDIHTLLQGYKF